MAGLSFPRYDEKSVLFTCHLMSSPYPHGKVGPAFCPPVRETLLAVILSRAGELPQPPTSSVSWPVQPQHPAARSSQRSASGGEETLHAIRHQVMISHDLESWNRVKRKMKVTGAIYW